MDGAWFGEIWLVRLLLQRSLAAIYLIAFVSALNQFRPLLGERGLLPVPDFVRSVTVRHSPSLFFLGYSDRRFALVAWAGIALSALALLGLSEAGPIWFSMSVWLALWVLYLSIVNVGQTFYGFGWESMLLEAGFFAAFLGPTEVEPSLIPVLALRWMLFRVEFGAGLIKLRHDPCWRDLTCLYYHHETQPLPNPLSWHFHHLPKALHRAGVLFSHFVQLIVPFGLFLPPPAAAIAGALLILHQLWLVMSGNYSWLNWLTIVLGLSAFSDPVLRAFLPFEAPLLQPRTERHDVCLYVLAAVTLLLSVQPTVNWFSKQQRMNFSYNPLHLVNTYGAFGSVTRSRHEVVLEGTRDAGVVPDTQWLEYAFKAKPGDPLRRPPQVAPYHLRLDWLMWFLPLRAGRRVLGLGLGHELWFLRLVQKLLAADASTLRLLRTDPFHGAAPTFVRARFYRYEFTTRAERRASGAWWKRRLLGEFLPPTTLAKAPTSHRSEHVCGAPVDADPHSGARSRSEELAKKYEVSYQAMTLRIAKLLKYGL